MFCEGSTLDYLLGHAFCNGRWLKHILSASWFNNTAHVPIMAACVDVSFNLWPAVVHDIPYL